MAAILLETPRRPILANTGLHAGPAHDSPERAPDWLDFPSKTHGLRWEMAPSRPQQRRLRNRVQGIGVFAPSAQRPSQTRALGRSPWNMKKIRVAIADPHPVVVAGLTHELGNRTSLAVIGTARTATQIVDLLRHTRCDVLVTGCTVPGGAYGEGLSLLAQIRRMFPDVRILVLTAAPNPAIARQIYELGVASTLCKSSDIDDVVTAIHALHHGRVHLQHPPIRVQEASEIGSTLLSQREVMVLHLYVTGMSISAIAAKIHRTKQTVSAQRRNAMRKLGIGSDAELHRFALQTGLSDALQRQNSAASTNISILNRPS
ncbi:MULTISPECIES: response regulator transcription factor [Pandoraea]|uniref:response regulator transcription factor n=1 Tax=Pandoraea TaxID=93217 RepID=UPI001F5D0FF3|nr:MULTISPECIES: response regulator transcription factor [Pandoraea]MCI3205066.1 hypothetical protein [Pandoraea sp. LA3]MDN4583094.1 hypothetical protein [Pandoraea capi]